MTPTIFATMHLPRESHDYTIRQRDPNQQVCFLVYWGDYRDGGVGGNPIGPFSWQADTSPRPTVQGVIDWDQQVALPANSRLTIELRDASFPSSDNSLIARQIIDDPTGRQNLKLKYVQDRITKSHRYRLDVWIHAPNDQIWFQTDEDHNVLTRGNPDTVNIELSPTEHAPEPSRKDKDPVTPPEDNQQDPPPTDQPDPETGNPIIVARPKPRQEAMTSPIPKNRESAPAEPIPTEQTASPDPVVESPAPIESPKPEEIIDEQPPVLDQSTKPSPEPIIAGNETKIIGFIWLIGYILVVLAAGLAALKLIDKKGKQ